MEEFKANIQAQEKDALCGSIGHLRGTGPAGVKKYLSSPWPISFFTKTE